MKTVRLVATFLGFFFAALSAESLWADIYVYIDANGVRHFDNKPHNNNWRLYLKTTPPNKNFKNAETDHSTSKKTSNSKKADGVHPSVVKPWEPEAFVQDVERLPVGYTGIDLILDYQVFFVTC